MHRYWLLLLLSTIPFFLKGQNLISGNFQNQELGDVLKELETQYQLVFNYRESLIKGKRVKASFREKTLEDGLALILESTSIQFKIVDDKYIILTKTELNPLRLCGKVQGADGAVLPFANIFSIKTLQGTSAQEDGSFEWFEELEISDTLEISYVGYVAKRITAGQLIQCPTIRLQVQSFSFSEVLVKEYVTTGIEQAEGLDHVVLRPKKIDVVPGLTEADVLQMVQILPGVQSVDESATGLHVRGGTPDQNLILWDGIPIYNGGHFFGMISAFNPYIVDEVNVYRSGFGAEYGGRISSVIDISSEVQIPENIQVNAGINFTHADASVLVPLFNKKSALLLSNRQAYTDVVESPTYKKLAQRVFQKGKIGEAQNSDDEELDHILDFNFSDFNAKWLWQPDAKNEIAVSFFSIQDQLNFFSENLDDLLETRDIVDLDNIGTSLKWQHTWNSQFSSKLLLTHTDLKSKYQLMFVSREDESGFTEAFSNVIDDRSLKLNNDWRIKESMRLNFGYQFTDLNIQSRWQFDDEEEDFTDNSNMIHTGYMTMTMQAKNKLRWNIGLRWNYAQMLERGYLEPRTTLQYLPDKRWQFKASAGIYYQFVSQIIELNDLGLNQQLWGLADGSDEDDDIPVSQSNNYTFGVLFNSSNFQLEVETYYKNIYGLTSFSPVFINSFQDDDFARGTGNAWGIDFLFKKKWKNYQNWLSYSYSRVKYRFEVFSNNELFPAPHDRPHSLTSMHQLDLGRWNLSLSWQLASGRVYTDAEAEKDDNDEVFLAYNYDQTNENRLPLYHRLDASILYEVFQKNSRLGGILGLSFLNIYDRRNLLSREYIAYENDETQEAVLEVLDRPMLRFTPNIVFRISWK